MENIYIGRQPVLDKNMQVFAYDIEFQYPQEGHLKPDTKAISQLIANIEQDTGFQSVVGKHHAILSLPLELTHPDEYPVFEHSRVLVQIPNSVLKDRDVLKNLREAKSRGMGIVLQNFAGDESSLKLASICDYVKIDIAEFSEFQLKEMLENLQKMQLKVIADNVETEEKFNYLKKLGFDFFQGYFFTNRLMINGTRLSGNKLTLLQLMAKVNDPNTDFGELSEIISQDVALSHKLLVAINNPACMIPVRVESIAEAVKFMGLKKLKFWVNMLMLSSMDDAPQELLVTSLMRAKFCEMYAEATGKSADKETYFLIGLFSNLGAFFRVPIEYIVSEMPLTAEITAALVHQEGDLGKSLLLLASIEQMNRRVLSLEIEDLDISELSQSFMAASAWAQQVVAE